jgi:RNA polymerase sigma factor (sigma-70 family)
MTLVGLQFTTGTMSETTSGESSLMLLDRARAGDAVALDVLLQRYLPRLRQWATGRLPRGARDLLDTEDIVQDTIIKAVRNLPAVEVRDEGALPAYLRQALMNKLNDEYRRAARRPSDTALASDLPAGDPSPLEVAIGEEAHQRYETALDSLDHVDREAVILRIELCYDYDEIATLLGKNSAASARMCVSRALARLSREMGRGTA